MIIALTAGAALIAYLPRGLTGRMLCGAAVFTAIYLVLFSFFLLLHGEFVPRYYNTANLLGWYVFGTPVEEITFAYSGSAVWSVIYESMQSYRLVSAHHVRPPGTLSVISPEKEERLLSISPGVTSRSTPLFQGYR